MTIIHTRLADAPRKKPDFASYHRSLVDELYATKDRIRNLVRHWPTDGEHEEAALRSVLRRVLPPSLVIDRRFVVNADAASTQADILSADQLIRAEIKVEGDVISRGIGG